MPKGIKGFQKGHITTEETKKKIGLANRGVWINYLCDYCQKPNEKKQSHYKKSKRHFCNKKCYDKFKGEMLPPEEHNNWKGGISSNEARKRWIARHREQYSFLRHKEYVRRHRDVVGSHSFEEWKRVINKFGNKCANCEQQTQLTKDHIIPLAKGGTNYISNIQPLCRSCNSRKWTKTNIHESPKLLKEVQK